MYLDLCARATDTTDNRCMIKRITEHQAALPHKGRNDHRVGCKAHAESEDILTSDKLGNFLVKRKMVFRRACTNDMFGDNLSA